METSNISMSVNVYKKIFGVLQLAEQVDISSTMTIVYFSNTIKKESLSFVNLNQI